MLSQSIYRNDRVIGLWVGQKQDKFIDKYELINKVHEKGYRANPLKNEQKANNKIKSTTRVMIGARTFVLMGQIMNGLRLKSVGIKRAKGIIESINLTYKLFRYKQIIRG